MTNPTLINNQYLVKTSQIIPIHGVRDQKLLKTLLESMGAKGWCGGPLVKLDSDLLTGSHRWSAAKQLEIDCPVVDVRDIFSLDEEDFNYAMLEDCWQFELTRLCWESDQILAQELGMDIH